MNLVQTVISSLRHLHLKPKRKEAPERHSLWAFSELQVEEEFSFVWAIKNYAAISREREHLESPIFKCPKTKHEWRLRIYPKAPVLGVRHLGVFLMLDTIGNGMRNAEGQPAEVSVKFEIKFCDPEGLPFVVAVPLTSPPNGRFQHRGTWGRYIIPTAHVLDKAQGVLVNDTLTIQCRGWIQGEVLHKVGQAQDYPENDVVTQRKLNIVSDLQSVRFDEKLVDFAISTSTKTFMAHKIILSARSSVFRAMLESAMQESATNTLQILDFDENVVKAMLDYIYSGVIEDLGDKMGDLLQIADKYELRDLKNYCEWYIASNFTEENAMDCLLIAVASNATELKKEAIQFISKNKDAVKSTESFKRISRSNAFADIFLSL